MEKGLSFGLDIKKTIDVLTNEMDAKFYSPGILSVSILVPRTLAKRAKLLEAFRSQTLLQHYTNFRRSININVIKKRAFIQDEDV